MTSTTARPTLLVWPALLEAFASVPANWLSALRIFWAWGAILFVIYITDFIALLNVRQWPSFMFMMLLLHFVVAGAAFASTAVAWHRLMLLGEHRLPYTFASGSRCQVISAALCLSPWQPGGSSCSPLFSWYR
jgi:hypothetical protein